jgi:antitoxin (DNA-binding transcriptional repressor) of toxin-antitoxin stability system
MEEIKTVGVKILKDQLSGYLRDVKAGCVVLVTERGKVVAEIHRSVRQLPVLEKESVRSQWIENGKLKPSRIGKRECRPSPITSEPGTAIALLNQERSD